MIKIKIGDSPNDSRTINKTFNIRTELNCEIAYPCDELQPQLIFSRGVILPTDNYCYIDYFKKYYFLGIPTHDGKRTIINCEADLLYTYSAELQEIPCTVIRTENGATDIPDNKYPINTNNYYLNAKYFPENPFTRTAQPSIILGLITSKNLLVGE